MMEEEHRFIQYWKRVRAADYPKDPRVPLPSRFANGAGTIQNLTDGLESCFASVIESDRKSIRSNHYHQKDWHFLYVACGEMLYYERPVGAGHTPEPLYVGKGQLVFTGPGVEHATVFLADTILVSLSRYPRDAASHESDVVRVPFLKPEHLGW